MKIVVNNQEIEVKYVNPIEEKLYITCDKEIYSDVISALENTHELTVLLETGEIKYHIFADWKMESLQLMGQLYRITFQKLDTLDAILAEVTYHGVAIDETDINLLDTQEAVVELYEENAQLKEQLSETKEELLDTQVAIAELYESLMEGETNNG